jgi:hypothetical protein
LPLALDAAMSNAGAAPDLGSRRDRRQQDVDYSPRGLFQQEHGDFMLKHERYRPMAEFSFALMPEYEIKGEPGSFDLYHSKADIEVPLYIMGPDAYLILGAYGSNRHYQVKDMPLFADENLNSAGAKFGFGAFFDRDLLLEVKVEPGIWSDMDGTLKHNDYDMPGSALLTWRLSDEAFFKAGARYNQVYEDAPWLPYLGFSWAIESFRVDVLLPELVEISWWPDSGFGLLLGTQIDGAQYRVRTDAASGSLSTNVQVQEIVVYTGMVARITDTFSFLARAGATVAGDYSLSNGNHALGYAEGTLDPGLFLQVSVGFDF